MNAATDERTERPWPIIDVHIHVGDRELWVEGALDLAHSFPGNSADAQWDAEGRVDVPALLRHMTSEGIAHAALIPSGRGPVSFETIEIAARSDGRLHAFVSIDPRLTVGAAERLDEAFERGAVGLKVHPVNDSIYPNDRSLYPLYEVCRSRRRPVMFHIGSSVFPGAKHRFADPMAVDEVAADFPELSIVCAHSGRGFWEEQVFFMARIRSNLFLELSGLPAARIRTSFPDLERLADRTLYGSDWPTSPALGAVADGVLALPYSEAALRAMTSENAARLLGIDARG